MNFEITCRATAAGTSSSHGIIGTLDGQVYVWNLLTGTKLGNIHHFEGTAEDDDIFGIHNHLGYVMLHVQLRRENTYQLTI